MALGATYYCHETSEFLEGALVYACQFLGVPWHPRALDGTADHEELVLVVGSLEKNRRRRLGLFAPQIQIELGSR